MFIEIKILSDNKCYFVCQALAKYFLKSDDDEQDDRSNVISKGVFSTKYVAPPCALLQPFENDLFELIKAVKFRNVNTSCIAEGY